MTTPYRDDTESLEARHAALAEELASVQAKAKELDGLKADEARLGKEVADVAKKLERRARRTLPLLESVTIATPCTASWDEMIGDDRSRFCTHCSKDVFNLSAIPRDEAEAFIRTRTAAVCVRLYKRTDGTVLTSDCPVGVTRKRRMRTVVAMVSGLLAGGALFSMWSRSQRCSRTMGEMVQAPAVDPIDESQYKMGDMAAPEPPPPAVKPKAPATASPAPKPRGAR